MTQPEQPSQPHDPSRDRIIEQAAAEGHDADISNDIGYVNEARDEEKDLERGILGGSSVSSATQLGQDEPERDPNIVDFDGPNDSENPMNWHPFKKWGTVSIVSALTFITPLASSQFATGVPQLMREFHSTSTVLGSFVVSVFVLGYAIGPLVIAPMSEMYGRLPLYHSCNLLFVAFTIAAAKAENMGQFIAFRLLMGCFGGAPLVLGGGTIADLIPREQRGTAMAVWMMGPAVGPCVGPIIGGFLTAAKGWRWNFWFVAILGGAFSLMALVLMSETSAVVILERKAKRLRTSTGNPKLRSKLDNGMTASELFKYTIVRPTKMLFQSSIVFLISIYIAIVYSYFYILFTTFTDVFETQYGWHGGIVGLSFIGVGIGAFGGQLTYVYFGNKAVKKHIERGDFKPEHRMPLMCFGAVLIPIGLFMYGWCVKYKVHWITPIIATCITGTGILYMWMPATTYLVDVFTVHAASAMAANTVLRSLFAAFLPLSSPDMYKAMGYGWGNSLLGFVATAMIPVPFLFLKYGERIRLNSKLNF